MTAQSLERLERESHASIERRREPRQRAASVAHLTSSYGETIAVTLSDMSSHGCAISAHADWVRAGAFVSIALDGHTPLGAIIRWVREGTAGMEFLGPIPVDRDEWHELLGSST